MFEITVRVGSNKDSKREASKAENYKIFYLKFGQVSSRTLPLELKMCCNRWNVNRVMEVISCRTGQQKDTRLDTWFVMSLWCIKSKLSSKIIFLKLLRFNKAPPCQLLTTQSWSASVLCSDVTVINDNFCQNKTINQADHKKLPNSASGPNTHHKFIFPGVD